MAKALAENDFAAFAVDELPVHAGVKPPKPPKKEPRVKTDEEKKTAILRARARLLTDLHLEAANCSAPSNLESHACRLLSRAACVLACHAVHSTLLAPCCIGLWRHRDGRTC